MTQVLEVFVGLEWGDEGKGKIVDERVEFAKSQKGGKRVIVVRFQGGANAGHTLYVRGKKGELVKFVAHVAPSGLVNQADVAIGPDVAFDPIKFVDEWAQAKKMFKYKGRILISERVGILMDYHMQLDAWRESTAGGKAIGTTKSGIGPFYEDNARRLTRITCQEYVSSEFPGRLREVLELKKLELSAAGIIEGNNIDAYWKKLVSLHEPIRKELALLVERLEYRLWEYLTRGDHIIIEGAQGSMLDAAMGSIPDVTASHLLAPHAFATLGLPRRRFKIYGVEKVYPTRVGSGVLPTLASDAFGDAISKNAGEFGATTGRKRRPGYPDWVLIRRNARLNDCDGIIITRADVVQGLKLKACTAYKIKGKKVEEVPLVLDAIEEAFFTGKGFSWKLWEGPEDLSDALKVDKQLEKARSGYVKKGFKGLPKELQKYVEEHDRFVGCKTVGVSIGPSRGETVWRI